MSAIWMSSDPRASLDEALALAGEEVEISEAGACTGGVNLGGKTNFDFFATAGACLRTDGGAAGSAPPGKYDKSMCAPCGVPGRKARTRTAWLDRNRTIRTAAWRTTDHAVLIPVPDFSAGRSNMTLVHYYYPLSVKSA